MTAATTGAETGGHGAVVAIDAGQTGMKIRLTREGAAPLEEVLPGIRTHEPLLPQLADAARAVSRAHDVRVDVLSAGVSGLTEAEADAGALRAALGEPVRVLLAHDSVTSYLGALGDRTGAVVAAGTGVVTLGVGRHRVARVDGWGNIVGDAGSGYWLGREAFDAVMRAYDGRGPQTALTAIVREQWPHLDSAYIALQADEDRVAQVASLARRVADLAETDAVAAAICRRGAAELALSVSTAIERVSEPGDDAADVSAIGGVFRSPFLRAEFERALAQRQPGVVVRAAQGEGIDGAAGLARLADGHALLGYVSVA